jgi:hypothetical protein
MLTQINCSIHGHQKNVNTNRWMQNITRVTVDLDNNLPVVHHSRLRRRGRAVGGVEATSESAAQSAGSESSASSAGSEGSASTAGSEGSESSSAWSSAGESSSGSTAGSEGSASTAGSEVSAAGSAGSSHGRSDGMKVVDGGNPRECAFYCL